MDFRIGEIAYWIRALFSHENQSSDSRIQGTS